jgi:hypothetical protein
VAVLGVVGVAVSVAFGASSGPAPVPVDWPGWGFTHTEVSADDGEPDAVRSVEQALSTQPLVQVQAIMGWGAGNPEPAPGRYDFASLDRRMGFIRRSGGIPVITLCCAPDWMKGGTPGRTNWSRLTVAPDPGHYADFAALAAVIARRYPDVHHFLVWNELKGFFDNKDNRWAADRYTELYNQVYAALKAVDPRIQVGGPYVDMASLTSADPYDSSPLSGVWGAVDPRALAAFDYWLQNKRGADFVVVDGRAPVRKGYTDEFTALQKFAAVTGWIRARTDLPVWWSEWYVQPPAATWTRQHETAVLTAAMLEFVRSGVQTALYWNPRPGGTECSTCLWTSTGGAGGGQPLTLLTDVLQKFARWFPPGTQLEQVAAPPGVQVLAQPHAALVVNTRDAPVIATIRNQVLDLAPYEIRWIT